MDAGTTGIDLSAALRMDSLSQKYVISSLAGQVGDGG